MEEIFTMGVPVAVVNIESSGLTHINTHRFQLCLLLLLRYHLFHFY